jgi:hypothetical protein
MSETYRFYVQRNVVLENPSIIRVSLWDRSVPLHHTMSLGPRRHIIHRLRGHEGFAWESPESYGPQIMDFESAILYLLLVRKLAEKTVRPRPEQWEKALAIAKRMQEPPSSVAFEPSEDDPSLLKILEALYEKPTIDRVMKEIDEVIASEAWKIKPTRES